MIMEGKVVLITRATGGLKYRFDGQEKLLAIGVHAEISLAQGRAAYDEAKALRRDNRDPNSSSLFREIGQPAKCTKRPLLDNNQPLSITDASFWGTQQEDLRV